MTEFEPLTPILDRILVKVIAEHDEKFENTSLDLEKHSKYRKPPQKGEVIAVGEGVYMGGVMIPMPVKRGDIVYFGEFGYEDVHFAGVDYITLRVADVKAVERVKREVNLGGKHWEHIIEQSEGMTPLVPGSLTRAGERWEQAQAEASINANKTWTEEEATKNLVDNR